MSKRTSLSELVTIVVAPREKCSSLTVCLKSLFSTIPNDVRVILCMPKLPQDISAESKKLIDARGSAELYEFEADLIPHNARKFGAEKVKTPWVVFTDNDIDFERTWLDKLAEPMMQQTADVVAPLIFIGPPSGVKIHHAGGLLSIRERQDGGIDVSENHRLMKKNIDAPGVQEALFSEEYSFCDVAEFHCLALRTELLQGPLELTKDLITREQQDLALQILKAGLRVQFVPESRVTYMALSKFTLDDLRYHASRWSEQRAKDSLDLMESAWGMNFNRSRVLYNWIEKHRRKPFLERESKIIKKLLRRSQRALGIYLSLRYGYKI